MNEEPVAGPSGSSEQPPEDTAPRYEVVNGFKFTVVDLPSAPTRPTSSVSADPPLSQPLDVPAPMPVPVESSSVKKSNKSTAEGKGKQSSKSGTSGGAHGKVKSKKTRPKKSKAAMAAEAEEKAAREANPEVGLPSVRSASLTVADLKTMVWRRPTQQTKARAKRPQPKARSLPKTMLHPRSAILIF